MESDGKLRLLRLSELLQAESALFVSLCFFLLRFIILQRRLNRFLGEH